MVDSYQNTIPIDFKPEKFPTLWFLVHNGESTHKIMYKEGRDIKNIEKFLLTNWKSLEISLQF